MTITMRGLRGVGRMLRQARDWFCDHWNCRLLDDVASELRRAVHDLRDAVEQQPPREMLRPFAGAPTSGRRSTDRMADAGG